MRAVLAVLLALFVPPAVSRFVGGIARSAFSASFRVPFRSAVGPSRLLAPAARNPCGACQ